MIKEKNNKQIRELTYENCLLKCSGCKTTCEKCQLVNAESVLNTLTNSYEN